MAPRDVSNCIRHSKYGQTERQCNPNKSNSKAGKCGCQYGTAASAKHQPESPEKLSQSALGERHSSSASNGIPSSAGILRVCHSSRIWNNYQWSPYFVSSLNAC